MNKPTVWHCLSNRWNSAITEYALRAAQSLKDEGYNSIFTPLLHSPAHKRAREIGLETAGVHSFSLGSLPSLLRIRKKHRPGIVVNYGGPETLYTRLADPSKQMRHFRFLGDDRLKPTSAASYTHIEKFLAPSHALIHHMNEVLPRDKSAVIPLGLPKQFTFKPGAYNPDARCQLLIFGRFDPVKGHSRFLEVFRELLDIWKGDHSPVLRIIGNPENISERDLWAKARELKLSEHNLQITPHRVGNLPTVYSSATLGVIPSTGSEWITRVANEFLLCGTPIWTTNVGSLGEVIDRDQDGYIYDFEASSKSNAQQLAKILGQFSNEPPEHKVKRATHALGRLGLKSMGTALDHSFSTGN